MSARCQDGSPTVSSAGPSEPSVQPAGTGTTDTQKGEDWVHRSRLSHASAY